MAVTIKEVAKEAGVSMAAVSQVLHGKGKTIRVGAERAQIIRDVAERLKYRPNGLARSLRSSRTHTIGLLFDQFLGIANGPLYLVELLDGVSRVALANHFRLTLLPEISEDNLIAGLADGYLEGVIWCKLPRQDAVKDLLAACPIPVVALNAAGEQSANRACYVSCDNSGGIELAVAHLAQLGHSKIAFGAEFQEETNPDFIDRRDAFTQCMTKRGLDISEGSFYRADWKLDNFTEWRQANDSVTAMIGWSERFSATFISQAQNYGLRIPHDLSVVGFDSTRFCDTITPKLTSVRQPIGEMAEYACRTLLSIIHNGPSDPPNKVFSCTFDVRESTGPPIPQR